MNKDKLKRYFLEHFENDGDFLKFIKGFKFKEIDIECPKKKFDKAFNFIIPCKLYSSVISGGGDEYEKINSFNSSSLQSLLFFAGIDYKHPLKYNGHIYNKVYFEFTNKVIGYPSSVDVVLVAEKKNKVYSVLFIESKLSEILRDSLKKEDKVKSKYCVGVSYIEHTNRQPAYELLKIGRLDYKKIGIIKPIKGYKNYGINPIKHNEYVYPYGIKQSLSHLIGIVNFINNENEKRIIINKNTAITFMTLINDLPNYKEDCWKKKKNDFKRHYAEVMKIVRKNIERIDVLPQIITYQNFARNIENDYFKNLSCRIKKYYHF